MASFPTISSDTPQWVRVDRGSSFKNQSFAAPALNGFTDKVSVSDLGSALSGVGGDLFGYLDGGARSMLEGLVQAGKITARDAVAGLQAIASEAALARHSVERKPGQEERERMKPYSEALDVIGEYFNKSRNSGDFGEASISDLEARLGNGEITKDEFLTLTEPYRARFPVRTEAVKDAFNRLRSGFFEESQANHLRAFQEAIAGQSSGNDLIDPTTGEAQSAKAKLLSLGFGRDLYGVAAKKFAYDADIPGIGRGEPWVEFAPGQLNIKGSS